MHRDMVDLAYCTVQINITKLVFEDLQDFTIVMKLALLQFPLHYNCPYTPEAVGRLTLKLCSLN